MSAPTSSIIIAAGMAAVGTGGHWYGLVKTCSMWHQFCFLHIYSDDANYWYVPHYVMEALTLFVVRIFEAHDFGSPAATDIYLITHTLTKSCIFNVALLLYVLKSSAPLRIWGWTFAPAGTTMHTQERNHENQEA